MRASVTYSRKWRMWKADSSAGGDGDTDMLLECMFAMADGSFKLEIYIKVRGGRPEAAIHSGRNPRLKFVSDWSFIPAGILFIFFFKFPRVKKCKSVSTGATLNTHTRTQHTRDALTEGTARTDRSGTSNGNRWNNGQVADRSAGLRFLSVR